MVFIRRLLFVVLLMGVFAAGFVTANHWPTPRIYAGQTFTIAPSEDSQAATGTVEIVAIQQVRDMRRIIFRAKTPNNTASRAVEIVMERQGLAYWSHQHRLNGILEVDGWAYLWGIFTPK